jgi:hypothetical protein
MLELTVESGVKHDDNLKCADDNHVGSALDDHRGALDYHHGRRQWPALHQCGDHGGHSA